MNEDCQEERDGVVVSGFCRLTLTAKAESHMDYCDIPELIRSQIAVTIPEHSLGKSHCPNRVWSAGFCLGMEVARLTKSLRHFFADWDEVSDGFAYEMEED